MIGNKLFRRACNARNFKSLSPSPILSKSFPKRHFTTDFPSAAEAIQNALQTIHLTYGLPWWATIATSTIFVRTSLLPLVRSQILASRKLSAAIPELTFLFQLLRNRLAELPLRQNVQRMEVLNTFMKGFRATLILHEVNLAEILFYPLVNFSVFVTFVYSVRDMVIHGDSSLNLDAGGLFWFTDLSDKDRTYLLPLAAIGISYGAIELALGRNLGKIALLLKDILQSMLLVSMSFVSSLPAWVFCYWLPSSLFGIAQTLALRNARIAQLLRIPPPLVPMKAGAGSSNVNSARTTAGATLSKPQPQPQPSTTTATPPTPPPSSSS